ncbi:DNA alkylation response protein [Pseudomaricurvus alcaniphilus]|uniref:acyl-CoA dehydrogenase family protein n=1 Tax=Pseudomaricurvus alcaniphilus TaxID=1166482 RepID=UPI00140C78BC|nr:acyl-CoA dehydrogenase family protein [Pseudomaricurvus alcaniphilus]NHN38462.1 DNA alkylation response protein [Pseudomaricurvus alcaniphilus]
MTATDNNSGATHEVFNQTPELREYNPLQRDHALQVAIRLGGAQWATDQLHEYSLLVGSSLQAAGALANDNLPILHSHDRCGNRIEEVRFHPAYHQLMAAAVSSGWPTLPWQQPQAGAHSARAAMEYLHHQADSGSGCPLTMTFAALPVIRANPALAAQWEPGLLSRQYDPRNLPYQQKSGLTIGMGMTEKQGGTDVRANTTRATPAGTSDLAPAYLLTGHKWFMSAPMCDAFLVLAQTEAGLGCFLLPRWRPDGSLNQLYFQRLKNKLGNRSNASTEVEFRGAFAWLLGDEGRGINTIMEMVALTRFDCMVGSAALMRQALVQAMHHCRHRQVGGKILLQQPLMQNVLTDLAIDSEAALHLSMRVARALDQSDGDPVQRAFLRLATAIGKYWLCKRAPGFIYEAMECLGGNGYVEDGILPRLYREAPVNAIWEGSGNVQCLDVLRTMQREPASLAALSADIDSAGGMDPHFDQYWHHLQRQLAHSETDEFLARIRVEQLALALQASLLLRHGHQASAEVFCRNRLGERHYAYGTLSSVGQRQKILDYAWT